MLQDLLRKYMQGTISETELHELEECLDCADTSLSEALASLLEEAPEMPAYRDEDWEPVYARIEARLPERARPAGITRRQWPRFAATAAIVLALLGVFLHKQFSRPAQVAPVVAHDIAPGGNKATLTLANGRVIDLGEAQEGLLDRQPEAKVVKQGEGVVAYQKDSSMAGDGTAYNTLATPRAGQYRVTLSDGTRVWLNAASSLRYPAAFHGRERVVELTGEAYFEVAPHSSMPFKVTARRTPDAAPVEVDVLGTHFDIMAYTDEPHIETTLLEGSVRVRSGDRSVLLRPGQQALEAGFAQKVDTDEVVAWKNGLFKFNEATLAQVMRQVSRWYDVDVVYQYTPSQDRFGGEMYRNVPVSKLLKVLQASGVHFRVEGRKIIVN
ncbi:FecR domain-containing protein [Dinghuibacter silviterrae]|uniref:FecR family protein n=1 Tax=Dinghuibacter silviterrae TaxID=1539049 RepID=A0A4R8DJ65_9BACT|nr:FecR domain-containing protein [Dinghuibacter silviterrae]TDW97050.1 FecR family protein [Dinghuibacter silviterrae]